MVDQNAREKIEEFRRQVDSVIEASPEDIDTLLVMAAVQGRMQRDNPTNVRTWLLGIVQALSTGELDLAAGGGDDQRDQTDDQTQGTA